MFEIFYIMLIAIQFVIPPIVAFVAMPTSTAWILFGVLFVAGLVQNIKFPCFAFRVTSPALAIMTLFSIYSPALLQL